METGRVILLLVLTALAMVLAGWLAATIVERQATKQSSSAKPPHSVAAPSH